MNSWLSLFFNWSFHTFIYSVAIYGIYKITFKIRMRPSQRYFFLKMSFLTLPLLFFALSLGRDWVTSVPLLSSPAPGQIHLSPGVVDLPNWIQRALIFCA